MKRVDITTSFGAHPDTGNLLIRSTVGSLQQSISNLILTERYERPHRPDVGTNIGGLLFEHISPSTGKTIKALVKETIENNEPRIKLNEVVVTPQAERNRYIITLAYTIKGEQTATKQQLMLTRTR